MYISIDSKDHQHNITLHRYLSSVESSITITEVSNGNQKAFEGTLPELVQLIKDKFTLEVANADGLQIKL
jgi:hypothetical protein